MDYKEKAGQLFGQGANCAQAVLCAYTDKLGMDEETLMKLASSFGGGMGRMREVCGAVTGMFMIAGLLRGYSDKKATTEKMNHYALIQKLAEEFKKENGSIICRELLSGIENDASPNASERTKEYYKKRPCKEYVECAAEIIDKWLEENI